MAPTGSLVVSVATTSLLVRVDGLYETVAVGAPLSIQSTRMETFEVLPLGSEMVSVSVAFAV